MQPSRLSLGSEVCFRGGNLVLTRCLAFALGRWLVGDRRLPASPAQLPVLEQRRTRRLAVLEESGVSIWRNSAGPCGGCPGEGQEEPGPQGRQGPICPAGPRAHTSSLGRDQSSSIEATVPFPSLPELTQLGLCELPARRVPLPQMNSDSNLGHLATKREGPGCEARPPCPAPPRPSPAASGCTVCSGGLRTLAVL